MLSCLTLVVQLRGDALDDQDDQHPAEEQEHAGLDVIKIHHHFFFCKIFNSCL